MAQQRTAEAPQGFNSWHRSTCQCGFGAFAVLETVQACSETKLCTYSSAGLVSSKHQGGSHKRVSVLLRGYPSCTSGATARQRFRFAAASLHARANTGLPCPIWSNAETDPGDLTLGEAAGGRQPAKAAMYRGDPGSNHSLVCGLPFHAIALARIPFLSAL